MDKKKAKRNGNFENHLVTHIIKKPCNKNEIKVFDISPLQERQVFVKDAQDSIFAANKVLLTDHTVFLG